MYQGVVYYTIGLGSGVTVSSNFGPTGSMGVAVAVAGLASPVRVGGGF